ncbi:MAG: 16S rRNA (cytosine(967)-C(5))-methyltransferase RsmB [Christensenellaceae bacterium]
MNARQVSLEVLSNVLKNKSYLNLELKQALRNDFSIEDKRFITALVSTTIENLYRIDYVLNQFITAKRVHTVIRNILRIGACQLLFFESVPVSAAVNESVKLVEKVGKRQLKGFVNATLRNLSDHLGKISYPDAKEDLAEFLHVFYSYPKWLCEKYLADYGEAQTEEMLSYAGDNAMTCVRINSFLQGADITGFVHGKYCEDAFYIKNASNIQKNLDFAQGKITVQGEASMICVRAAGIKRTDCVIDTCAAPGGKSAYAAQFASEGSVTALDIHEHRTELIENTFERLHIKNASVAVVDATKPIAEYEQKFDVVLIDAPCSALGLLYRKPDIKIFKNEEDLEELVQIQRALLEVCSSYVKKGGILLYSTCTINKQENDENIDVFLTNHKEFVGDSIKEYLPEALQCRANNDRIQLFAHIDGIDGFFMARLKRI